MKNELTYQSQYSIIVDILAEMVTNYFTKNAEEQIKENAKEVIKNAS